MPLLSSEITKLLKQSCKNSELSIYSYCIKLIQNLLSFSDMWWWGFDPDSISDLLECSSCFLEISNVTFKFYVEKYNISTLYDYVAEL